MHEGDGSEGGKQRQHDRDIQRAGQAGGRSQKQQRGNAAGAQQLRRHHAIDVRRPAEDPHQSHSGQQQDEHRGAEQEPRHPATPALWPSMRMNRTSSSAICVAAG